MEEDGSTGREEAAKEMDDDMIMMIRIMVKNKKSQCDSEVARVPSLVPDLLALTSIYLPSSLAYGVPSFSFSTLSGCFEYTRGM